MFIDNDIGLSEVSTLCVVEDESAQYIAMVTAKGVLEVVVRGSHFPESFCEKNFLSRLRAEFNVRAIQLIYEDPEDVFVRGPLIE